MGRHDLRRLDGVADTFDLDGARTSYYTSLFPLNPSGIVPAAPEDTPSPLPLDLDLEGCFARREEPVQA